MYIYFHLHKNTGNNTKDSSVKVKHLKHTYFIILIFETHSVLAIQKINCVLKKLDEPFPSPHNKKLKEFIDWSRDRLINNSMQQGTLKFLTYKSLPQAWLKKSKSKVSHPDLEKDLGDLAPNQFILPGILGMGSSEALKVKVKPLNCF